MRKVGFAALIVAFLLFLSVIPATSTSWEPHVNVTNDTQDQRQVSLFVDSDGYAHIAWSNTTEYIGIKDITGYIFYSNNLGGSFGTPVLIPAPVNGSWSPSIAVDSNRDVHIAFFGGNVTAGPGAGTSTDYTTVFYSTNKGSSDGSFQTINLTDYFSPAKRNRPDLALDSNGYVHIAWKGYDYDIYYAENTSGDFVIQKVTNQVGDPVFDNPSLALDDSDVPHIVFYGSDGDDKELFYTTPSVGAAWVTPINVTSDPFNATKMIDDEFPDISFDDELVHITWVRSLWNKTDSLYERLYAHIFYTNGSIKNGFQILTQVSSGGNIHTEPSISLDSLANAHIAWKNITSWPFSVLYTNNTGGSFGTTEDISFAHGHHYSPSVFIDNEDYIHVAFAGYATASGPIDVFYLNSGRVPTPISEFSRYLYPMLILALFTTLIIGMRYTKKKIIN